MKKILIYCYDFPPLNSAGAARPAAWFRYARKYGFEPVVVSRSWPVRVDRLEDRFKTVPTDSPYEITDNEFGKQYAVNHKNSFKESMILKYGFHKFNLLRKIISLFELIGRFNFGVLDDKYEMYQALCDIVKIEKPDIIVATGEPHILFVYCYRLWLKTRIPYVVDYRDGWFTNHTRVRSGILNKIVGQIELYNEKKALKQALFFTSVMEQLVESIHKDVYPQNGYVLPNGVDLSLFKTLHRNPKPNIFSLVYTGTLYDTGYIPIFEKGIKLFLEEHKPTDFEVCFFGINLLISKSVDTVKDLAKLYPNNIKIMPRVSYQEVLQEQLNATALLALISGSQEKGIIGMKTYEYLASKRPIIAIQSEPSRKTSIFPDKDYQILPMDAEEFAQFLGNFYNRFKSGEDLTTKITEDELYSISREKSSQELFSLINQYLNQAK